MGKENSTGTCYIERKCVVKDDHSIISESDSCIYFHSIRKDFKKKN